MSDQNHPYRGLVVDVDRETVELPNGVTCELEIVRHPGGAAVVAVDEHLRVCLLRQYRHVAGGWLWELPAGKLENNEPPQATARRELEEEAGVTAERWSALGPIFSSPGVFSEVIHLYLARGLKKGEARPEDHEFIEVHWMPLAEAVKRAVCGEITDAKTLSGLFRAQALLPT